MYNVERYNVVRYNVFFTMNNIECTMWKGTMLKGTMYFLYIYCKIYIVQGGKVYYTIHFEITIFTL